MALQRTIKNEVCLEGVGLHTGRNIKIIFKPAGVDTGVNFLRTDLPQKPLIPGRITDLSEPSRSPRRTTIGSGEAAIHTVEHLLATLHAFEIDNILIDINGPELPGLDGSAAGYVKAINQAGIKEQDKVRTSFMITEPIWVEDGDSALAMFPDVNLTISYTLDYPTTHIKTQYNKFMINKEIFEKEIAPSRTFCLEEEVEKLRSLGLGKGASLENTLVLGKNGIINGDLRFSDELLRHKVLDLIGDLYLFGFPVKGHIIGVKSGHSLNTKLIQKIRHQYDKFLKSSKNIPGPIPPFSPNGQMDSEDIKKILPHRYPFLMIDRILKMEELSAVGVKNLSTNDYFFAGHFPGKPVMPGVLILEAMAQVGGVLMLSKVENKGKIAYFMSINNAKFRRVVNPGDQLRLEIEVTRFKSRTGQVHANAYVGDSLVAEADLMFVLGEAGNGNR